MKKLILILISVITVSFMTSCESYDPLYFSKIPRQYAKAVVMTEPVILEIDTITGIIYDTVSFIIPNIGSSSEAKEYFENNADHYIENAMMNMARQNNVDEIINFKFNVEILTEYKYNELQYRHKSDRNDGSYEYIRVLVFYTWGYGVKYKAMRKATKEDLWMSEFNK